ncbi:Ig-like domain-containing protein [Clostridium saccharoperbutylacetonicum]|jgi:uncharacterized repeat protein (TIGR01451 family)
MKNYFKKFSIMFFMALILISGSCVNAFADDTSQSMKINNTNLNFNKIIYVDSNNGNDTSGNGSQSNPYQSLWKCLNYLSDNNLKNDVAIVMNDGDYDWTPISSGYSCNVNSKFNGMKVSFIAKNRGKAFIKSTNGLELLIVEGNSSWRIKFSFYGLVFHNISGDGNYVCLGGDDWTNEYYNCVFDNLNIGGWNGKISNASIITVNCLFKNCSDGFYTRQPLSGQGINNASTNSIIDPYSGAKTKSLTNVIADAEYNITSSYWKNSGDGTNPDGTQANIGVYGGKFAWGTWNNVSSLISLDKSSMNLNVGDFGQLTATTTPAGAQVTWKSSDTSIATVDSTGKVIGVKEGTCTITVTTADGVTATCIVTITPKGTDPASEEKIVNIAHAKGDNTNNPSGEVTIIFHGTADTMLSVVKTADVKDVWIGDNFTYTLVITNTGTKTAKAVVVNDPAPNHIDFNVSGVTTTQGTVDSSSTSKNIIVNVGDILPGGTVTIKIPSTVIA